MTAQRSRSGGLRHRLDVIRTETRIDLRRLGFMTVSVTDRGLSPRLSDVAILDDLRVVACCTTPRGIYLGVIRPRVDLDTGRVEYGDRSGLGFDVKLRSRSGSTLPFELKTVEHPTLVNLVSDIHSAMLYGAVEPVPVLPYAWYGFDDTRPAKYEVSNALRSAALDLRTQGSADGDPSDEELRAAWDASEVRRDGMSYRPQSFFVRDQSATYDVHPVDGSSRPHFNADRYVRKTVGGWVAIRGVWVPRAQTPRRVAADCRHLTGRTLENPAVEALRAVGVAMPLRSAWFAMADDEKVTTLGDSIAESDTLFPEFRAHLANEMRRRMAPRWADMAPDDDLFTAALDPRKPLVLSHVSRPMAVQMPKKLTCAVSSRSRVAWGCAETSFAPLLMNPDLESHLFSGVPVDDSSVMVGSDKGVRR